MLPAQPLYSVSSVGIGHVANNDSFLSAMLRSAAQTMAFVYKVASRLAYRDCGSICSE